MTPPPAPPTPEPARSRTAWIVAGVAAIFALGIAAGAALFSDDDPITTSAVSTTSTTLGTTASTEPTSTTLPASTTGPTTTTTAVAATTTTCTNDVYGWMLDYPASWFTDDGGDPELTCSFFDPDPFQLERDTEPAFISVFASHVAVGLDDLADYEQDPEFVLVLDQRTTTIDGRRAVVYMLEETGAGYFEAGWLRYEYLVEWGPDATMLLGLTNPPGPFFDQTVDVVDAMAASLQLGPPPT